MHSQSPFLLLTALLATTTTTVLAKDPYLHSFATDDCTGPDAGDKVSIPLGSYDCVRFDSVYNTVQINFGTDLNEIEGLNVFSDTECQVYAGKAITSPRADNTPAQCVDQAAHGAKWGSVQQALKH